MSRGRRNRRWRRRVRRRASWRRRRCSNSAWPRMIPAVPGAPGWTEHLVFGLDDEVFYFHAGAGVVQWEPPTTAVEEVREVLGAPGWEQHFSPEEGEVFYLHSETGDWLAMAATCSLGVSVVGESFFPEG